MAKVTFKRVATDSAVNDIPVLDGQLIYSAEGKTYMDYETTRVPINGTTDDTMSDSSSRPVENRTIKSYVDTNISTIANTIHNGTILWTNSDPTSAISTNKLITLSSSNYDVYEVVYAYNTSNLIHGTEKSTKGYGVLLTTVSGTSAYRRIIEYVSDTSLRINAQDQSQNSLLIPLYVIGYNTGLFS